MLVHQSSFFSSKVRGIVVDNAIFSLIHSRDTATIIWGCPKSPKILRVQAPRKIFLNLHPCLAAHHADKYGKIIPTGPNVIRPNMQNHVHIFEFLLHPHFLGISQDSSEIQHYKVPVKDKLHDWSPKSLTINKILTVKLMIKVASLKKLHKVGTTVISTRKRIISFSKSAWAF